MRRPLIFVAVSVFAVLEISISLSKQSSLFPTVPLESDAPFFLLSSLVHQEKASTRNNTLAKRPYFLNTTSAPTFVISSSNHINHTNASSSSFPYAYAYFMGGCDPAKPTYKGYLYNILMGAYLLRQRGSRADIVAFVQMAYESKANQLTPRSTRRLEQLGVQIRYIPKSATESFYEAQLEKFRILQLTEYRRVLFLDADVLPIANVDYLFELSEAGVLKDNLVLSGPSEPSNGGFFMLKPGAGEFEELQRIIHKREIKAKTLTGRKFDPIDGWGHVIEPPDYWATTRGKVGTNWTFMAAMADQGLLYYWVKYHKKNASLVRSNLVENWVAGPNGTVVLEETLDSPFSNYSLPITVFYHECNRWAKMGCPGLYRDFIHYSAKSKPWLNAVPPVNRSRAEGLIKKKLFWWYVLDDLNDKEQLGIDFDNWDVIGKPSLGFYPSVTDMTARVENA